MSEASRAGGRPIRVLLHGPQRFQTTVGETVAALDGKGPVATVTAGWREREGELDELDQVLGGRSHNLRLYERWRDIAARDPEFGAAEDDRRRRVAEAQEAYAIRVRHAVAALEEVHRRGGDPAVEQDAVDDGIAVLRQIDAQHLARGQELDAAFYDRWQPHERDVVAAHRDDVAALMSASAAVAIAGGHVGDLLACLHLFNVAGLLEDRPVVAWSAGAMAVADVVVLFNDHDPDGVGYSEAYRHGLGLARGVVPLPHAPQRLRLADQARMSLMARRFAPSTLLVLDHGAVVDLADGTTCPPDAVVVAEDGTVGTVGR
jgi:hypothetical protein